MPAATEAASRPSEDPLNLATDDLAYRKQLGLMRGHLHVGYALFEAGEVAQAKTHMKHPKHELYADLVPAFTARSVTGFGRQLEALSSAVAEGQGADAVRGAYEKVVEAIAQSENAAPAKNPIRLAATLVREAAEEYAEAVVDSKMRNAHEYQDALGFTHIARVIVSGMDDEAASKGRAIELLDGALSSMWPGLVPPDTLSTSAEQLGQVADALESLASGAPSP